MVRRRLLSGELWGAATIFASNFFVCFEKIVTQKHTYLYLLLLLLFILIALPFTVLISVPSSRPGRCQFLGSGRQTILLIERGEILVKFTCVLLVSIICWQSSYTRM